jgi:pimeloyl-ACP methyl ester carboxylesterase
MRAIISIICGFVLLSCSPYVKESKEIFTKDGVRLKLVKSHIEKDINLIFVPGGPGIDSSYLTDLANSLNVRGNIWLLDLPDNGSNIRPNTDFNKWSDYLLNAIKEFDNVILVGHSFGGTLILSDPRIEKHLNGLILLDSTPELTPEVEIKEREKYNLPNSDRVMGEYLKQPSNYALKNVVLELIDYYFIPSFKEKGINFANQAIYNHHSFDWAVTNFFPTYEAKYIPKIPTLILSGEFDHVLPLYVFTEDQRFKSKNFKTVKIKDAGHFPWVEKPEEVKLRIEEFINPFNLGD